MGYPNPPPDVFVPRPLWGVPRPVWWAGSAILVIGLGTTAAWQYGKYRDKSRRAGIRGPATLISCFKHQGEEICIWQLEQGTFTFTVSGGAPPEDPFANAAAATTAGRAFVDLSRGQAPRPPSPYQAPMPEGQSMPPVQPPIQPPAQTPAQPPPPAIDLGGALGQSKNGARVVFAGPDGACRAITIVKPAQWLAHAKSILDDLEPDGMSAAQVSDHVWKTNFPHCAQLSAVPGVTIGDKPQEEILASAQALLDAVNAGTADLPPGLSAQALFARVMIGHPYP